MKLLLESRTTRKILLLQGSQSEILILSSRPQIEAWPAELAHALEACARRGIRVRVLAENESISASERAASLESAGAEFRQCRGALAWLPRQRPLNGEFWIFDRAEVMAVNARSARPSLSLSLSVECLLGSDVAHGAAAYFDQRWSSSSGPVAFSVRHKNYSLYSGSQSAEEFYACVVLARKEIVLSLPESRISKRVEGHLHAALSRGVRVTVFLNAEREDAPALRRLRRLTVSGAVLKICGRRLRSECAIVDRETVYMGAFPTSWRPLPLSEAPSLLVQNEEISRELIEALEGQVSVEISRPGGKFRLQNSANEI